MGAATGNGKATRAAANNGSTTSGGFWRWVKSLFGTRNGDSQLRETIEEIIEEFEVEEGEEDSSLLIGDDERVMLSNILKLRHLTAYDVMVPRADIVAIEMGTPVDDLIELMSTAGHSRVPVYHNTLDEVVGLVHIKDVMDYVRRDKAFQMSGHYAPGHDCRALHAGPRPVA